MSESLSQGVTFEYPIRHDHALTDLAQLAGLEQNHKKSELEKAKDIIGYTHGLFDHDGDSTPTSADPLTILKEAQAGKSFRCVEYSTLAAGLLWANDIPARTVGLKTSDVETRKYGAGHVIIEFWSHDLSKWIMGDVQAGLVPEVEGTPLSAYELKQYLDAGKSVRYASVPHSEINPDSTYGEESNYSDWIHEYLYFIDTPTSLTLGNEDKPAQQIAMLVPENTRPPRMFQGMFAMNAVYTDQPQSFYKSPINNN